MVKKTGELKVAGVVNQHLLRNNNLTAGKYIVNAMYIQRTSSTSV